MNNHAATYNPSRKNTGSKRKGGDRSNGIPASGRYKDVFVNVVENHCWGLSRLPASPRLTTVAVGSPPTGEKEEDDGNAAQWREGDEADAGGNRGEDAGRRERG
jgi:hypothetical protein